MRDDLRQRSLGNTSARDGRKGCAQSHASDWLVGSAAHPAVSAALKIIAIRVLQVMVDIPSDFQGGYAGVGATEGLFGLSVVTAAA